LTKELLSQLDIGSNGRGKSSVKKVEEMIKSN